MQLSNAELMAVLGGVNAQQLALTSYAATRVRGTSTSSLVALLSSVHNRATARQKWIEITSAEGATSASLRTQFVQAQAELVAASAELVDLRFAEAEVRMLRSIVMTLESVLQSHTNDPDLQEEVSILYSELQQALYSATTLRSELREHGPEADAGIFGIDAGGPVLYLDAGGGEPFLNADGGPGGAQDAGPGQVQDAATSDAGT